MTKVCYQVTKSCQTVFLFLHQRIRQQRHIKSSHLQTIQDVSSHKSQCNATNQMEKGTGFSY